MNETPKNEETEAAVGVSSRPRGAVLARVAMIGVGFVAGIACTVVVAYSWGPYTSRTERDPITNRVRVTETRVAIRTKVEMTDDAVSAWVDSQLPKGVYFGQYGWLPITMTDRRWFGYTSIGCGGPGSNPTIPRLIYEGAISEPGLSKEALLAIFISELPAAYAEAGTLKPVLDRWRLRSVKSAAN